MVASGCIAKVLRGLECRSNVWIRTVNPCWYEAREIPTARLTTKVFQAAQPTTTRIHATCDKPKIEESAQKVVTPMNQPYF